MSDVLVLDRARTRAALDPHRVMAAVARALIAISRGEASAPPRVAARAPGGLLGVMPGYVPGLGLAAKLVSVFADPADPGRGAHRGIVALFDPQDGRPLALLDAESLTAIRTAASATHSALALAPPGPGRIAVLGSGAQARAQLSLLALLKPAVPVTVAGRDPGRVREAAGLHPAAVPAPHAEAAVRGADVVFCCTGAARPVISRSWLVPGAHVSSVGGSHGPEVDADTVRDAALFTEWPGASTTRPPSGAHELQNLPGERTVTLLGSVLSGHHPGRGNESGPTLFKSTGHAALDVAAAHVAYTVAVRAGWGTVVDL
ncbi:alanine dehydrogenase [Streptomyces sp. V3I8]|uniref:ornithine cyclodeaminase family protein n=1 Tax=Streptomyces sp. V3I8 TaxID=3042279 RepID=UPI00277D2E84|nr:ornithine cyclodeaminase family protein [Streptomyces sp. V3I8]MDQ1033891.1 alanine dehydrogenase [Streptomyces sp. V3I8]